MSARANLFGFVHSGAEEADLPAFATAVDTYRTEVLAKAIGRLRAIPVTCTALTGPVWYGDGWNSAITVLEEIAEYQTPDDEAFPGELQRLRSLVLGLRVAAIRKNDLAEVQRLLDIYEETRKAATTAGTTPVRQDPESQHYDKVPDPADGCHWCACGNRWPCKRAAVAP